MVAMATELTQVLVICEVNISCTIENNQSYLAVTSPWNIQVYMARQQHEFILFYFRTGDEKYLVGIIAMAVLLVISMAITGYFICQNRRLKSLKKNPEKMSKEGNNSIDDHEIPAEDEGNYEEVENEQSTYTALKKPGERDDNDHVYTHLVHTQKICVNQEESRF